MYILAQDKTVYVLERSLAITLDGERRTANADSFGYFPTDSSCSWGGGKKGVCLLVFHLPGGFDLALARSVGDDDRMKAHREVTGTRCPALSMPGSASSCVTG